MPKGTHGGRRTGSGAKNRGLTNMVKLKLTDTEFEAYNALGGKPSALRYLLRKEMGLCLHDIQEMDETGILICTQCGAQNPETWKITKK